jgi:cyclophilin family peptidyl-prolyl cis-trans isomerase
MSTSAPPQVDTSSPNPIEMFWDRNRTKLRLLFYVLLVGLLGYYGLKYYNQKQLDAKWATFAHNVQLDIYEPESLDFAEVQSVPERFLAGLDEVSMTELQQRLDKTGAKDVERAYLLWLMANKAKRSKDWAAARSNAEALKAGFPEHPLCLYTDFPVQVRLPVIDKDAEKQKPNKPNTPSSRKETEYDPAVSGSTVDRFLASLEKAEAFQLPAAFARVEVPASAPRYKIQFSEPYGSITIALMTEQAPEHCRIFEEIAGAEEPYWNGMKIDQIYKPNSRMQRMQPGQQFHFGFASTREADRTKWDTSKPADEAYVTGELSTLSHWEGAISARTNADGKSEVSRLWVCVDDRADQDQTRQVFAFVVEGLENAREIVESGYERTEDENSWTGGRPAENIEIVSVTKVE